jgi:predicted transport protein
MTQPISFEDHVTYTDAVRRPLLRQLRHDIVALDDRLRSGETVTTAQRIVYKIPGGKNFIEIKVQRGAILVRLIETGVHDTRRAVRKIPETHGWGDLKEEIRISDASDAKYALQFIKAAYQIAGARH